MNRYSVPLVLLAATCAAQPAFAQISPFRGSRGTPLTSTDMTALIDGTNRLLDRPQLVPGGTETWSNPQSGASGTITAGSPASRKGLACRVVTYQTMMPGGGGPSSRTLTWCKTPDGWKIG